MRYGLRTIGYAFCLVFLGVMLMQTEASVRLQAPPLDLAQHHWEDRVILLFAPENDDPTLKQQVALLQAEANGIQERQLVIYRITGASDEAAALHQQYEVAPDAFAFLLIGKDGETKLHEATPVTMQRLFGIIDAMPMRQREMTTPPQKRAE